MRRSSCPSEFRVHAVGSPNRTQRGRRPAPHIRVSNPQHPQHPQQRQTLDLFIEFADDGAYPVLLMIRFLREFAGFLRTQQQWWLIPLIVFLVLLAAVVFFSQGSALSPFMYKGS